MRILTLALCVLLLAGTGIKSHAAGGSGDPGCVYGATSSIRLHSQADLQFSPEILNFHRNSPPPAIRTKHRDLCESQYGLEPGAKRHVRCMAGKLQRSRAFVWLAESGDWLAELQNRSSPVYHRVQRAHKALPRKILDQEHREHATLTPGCPLWLRESSEQEILET